MIPDFDRIAAFLAKLGPNLLRQQESDLDIEIKSDGSKVSSGDIWVHEQVYAFLKQLTPEIPIVSEEGALPSQETLASWPAYWCLDPIDNTHGFIEGSSEFVISLGLVIHQVPTYGWIAVPHEERVYYTTSTKSSAVYTLKNQGIRPIRLFQTEVNKLDPIPIVMSSRCQQHPDFKDYLDRLHSFYEGRCHVFTCSSALKFCRLLDGDADAYFRLGRTKLWDVAGGFALSKTIGKKSYVLSSPSSLRFDELSLKNLPLLEIPPFLIA